MAIDANAMYRAGFGSKSTGRNVQVDERNARIAAITKTAFNVLGQAAIGQIKQNYRGLQEYRNASDSQTSLLNLQVDKMPVSSGDYYVGENESLKGSILELKSLYDAAARKASFGIGKGRNKGRQDMARYMKQLSDMNAVLEIYKASRDKSKTMLGVLSGVTNSDEGAKTVSAGSNAVEVGNTTQQATGALGARLRWNIEAGEMEVQVGGDWGIDDKGRNIYKDKAETGTYEEYVAAQNAPIGEGDNEVERLERSKNQENNFYPLKEGGPKEAVMSREEWTKLNQENRGLISQTPWSTLKFAEKEDKTTSNNLAEYADAKIQDANSRNSLTWDQVTENEKEEFVAKMDEYTDLQFRDYFFGGGTFTASATRIPNSAPAYLFLKEEDEKNGNFKDGEFKEGFGPGNENWEGRILTLQGQSFVKGSQYRKTTAEQQWDVLGEKYKTNRKNWRIANPEKDSGDGGSYGGRKVPLSVQQSKQRAAAIDKVVGSKINEQAIKKLKLELGARTTVTTLRGKNARKAGVADGTIQIMDSADNAYMINPNDPIDARSILYGLAKINQEDRDEQIMGIASDADDPKTGKTENDYFNMITE